MKPIDWIIIGLAVAAVVGVVVWQIRRKKQGKGGCDCGGGCGGCHGCSSCSSCNGGSFTCGEKTEE